MKTIRYLVMLICMAAADFCHAEIISIVHRPGFFAGVGEVVRTTFSGTIAPPFSRVSVQSTVDTVLDTGAITDADLVPTPATSRREERATTIIIPPTNFPDPPIVEVKRFIETLTLDPITVPVEFVSGTSGPITYQNGYRFPAMVTFRLLDSFTLSGTYKVEGPTEMVEVPFTTEYRRTSAGGNVSRDLINLIILGANFPTTANVAQLLSGSVGANYSPTTTAIFNGTVDGQSFRAELRPTIAGVSWTPVPEPSRDLLYVLSLVGSWICYAHRGCREYD